MSNAERVTRTLAVGPPDKEPPSLVGPTSQQDDASAWAYLFFAFLRLWVPGRLSSKYWIWIFFYFFPNFLFPIGPRGAYCLGLWSPLKTMAESGPARERSWSFCFWVWPIPKVDLFVLVLVCILQLLFVVILWFWWLCKGNGDKPKISLCVRVWVCVFFSTCTPEV